MSLKNILKSAVFVGAATALGAGQAQGAGFEVKEQKPGGIGSAFSDVAAADDPSVVWFNPAFMTNLGGFHGSVGGHIIVPFTHFKKDAARSINTVTGSPVNGDDGGNGSEAAFVPSAYVTQEFKDVPGLWGGLGFNFPFGLTTEYDAGWVGRYNGLTSRLRVANFSPALAYKIAPWLSVGAGFDAQKLDVRLSQAADASTICLGTALAAACAGGGAVPQNQDTQVELDANSWGFGFNGGISISSDPWWDGTRIGINYRSAVTHDVDGSAEFTNGGAGAILAGATGIFTNTTVESGNITLPERVRFQGYHRFNPHWAVHGTLDWIRWSRVQEIAILFQNPAQAASVLTFNYNNTLTATVGATYNVNEDHALQVGFSFDQSPQGNRDRNVRLPDNDRFWFTLGNIWNVNNSVELRAGYAFIFGKEARVDQVDSIGVNRVVGDFDATVHLLNAQVLFKFDP